MLSNAMDGKKWVFLLLVKMHHSLWHFPVVDGKMSGCLKAYIISHKSIGLMRREETVSVV